MPRQRPETRERVRKEIEDAALNLIAEKGYEQTGMRDVAGAIGMSPASLYNHYESKEALFSAVVGRYRSRIADESEENPLRSYMLECDFPRDIARLADALEAVVVRDKQYLVLWYIDLIHFSAQHFRNELAPTLLLETPALKKHLRKLGKSGALRGDPVTLFKIVYVHLFNFFLTLHVFDAGQFFGGDRKKKAYVRQLEELFLHGMLVDDHPARAAASR